MGRGHASLLAILDTWRSKIIYCRRAPHLRRILASHLGTKPTVTYDRKTATEYDRKTGIKLSSGTAE